MQVLLGLFFGGAGGVMVLFMGVMTVDTMLKRQEGFAVAAIMAFVTFLAYIAAVAGMRMVSGQANGPDGLLPTWSLPFFGAVTGLLAVVLLFYPSFSVSGMQNSLDLASWSVGCFALHAYRSRRTER